MAGDRTKRIAELNDRLRAALGTCCGVPGMVVTTCGIAALDECTKVHILQAVRHFQDFSEDSDPYGEHDFGKLEIDGVGRVLWKIDYYADVECVMGSEDPADTNQSYGVLTIMLACEY